MKTLTKLDKYLIAPNLGFYGGFIFDGEDITLCDDKDIDENYECNIKQYIKDNVLITDLAKKYEIKKGKSVVENSHLEIELEVGELIVYVEGQGFVIPEYKMLTVDKVIEQYNLLRGDDDEVNTSKEEDTRTD